MNIRHVDEEWAHEVGKLEADEDAQPTVNRSAPLDSAPMTLQMASQIFNSPALREAALHQQLFRYANDLNELLERHDRLERQYESLRESMSSLGHERTMLANLAQASDLVYLVSDHEGLIRECNQASQLIAPLGDLIGHQLAAFLLPDSRPLFRQLLESMGASGEHFNRANPGIELELHCQSGLPGSRLFHVRAMPAFRPDGDFDIQWLMRDISSRHQVHMDNDLPNMLFQHAGEGVMITAPTGTIISVNPAFCRITGYAADEVVGRTPSLFGSGLHDAAFFAKLWTSLKNEGHWQGEIYNRRKDGSIYPEWLTVSAARDTLGEITAYIALYSDISHLMRAEARLSHLAHHDTLTGLPNRSLLHERLSQQILQSRRDGRAFSLIFIDLDKFKFINDSWGHDAGDAVLRITGERMLKQVREVDTVARLGGDEFIILAPGLTGMEGTNRYARKLIDSIGEVIDYDGHKLLVGASVGIAQYPHDGEDDISLLRHADAAMYNAKASGGNMFTYYKMNSTQDGNLGQPLVEAMREALAGNEFYLVYQPQIAIEDEGYLVTGAEALLRWKHPELGEIYPDEFIPLAEESGVILQLGQWVLRTACQQLAAWHREGMTHLNIAVNVSPRQLRSVDFGEQVLIALEESGLQPSDLELELTETELMLHPEGYHNILAPLRERGIKVAIDDFGTGYSSLARLRMLPIDRLKIDRSFIADLGQSEDAHAISSCVVSMGRALGLEVIAEGVENADQYQALQRQGCHSVQGFLMGRPMPATDFSVWAKQRISGSAS